MPSRLRIKAAIVAAAAVLAVLAAAGAAQALLVTMPLSTMTREARRVIVADVWSVKAQRVRSADGRGWGTIETMVRLRVRDTLKGSAPRWLTIRVPGGAAEGRTLVVEDAPRFAAGGRYLIFVDDDGSVVDWRRGALRVRGGRVPELNAGLSAAKSAVRAGKDLPRRAASASETPASGTGQALATLFSEDFEGVWPGSWTLGGTPTWGKTSNRKNGGSSSAYCVQSTTPAPGPYGAGVDSYMYAGPFNLSGATQGWLDFDRWLAAGTGDSVSLSHLHWWQLLGRGLAGLDRRLLRESPHRPHQRADRQRDPRQRDGQPPGLDHVPLRERRVHFRRGRLHRQREAVTKDVTPVSSRRSRGISPGSASAGTGSAGDDHGDELRRRAGDGQRSPSTTTAPIASRRPSPPGRATQIVCTVPTGTVDGYAASAGSGPDRRHQQRRATRAPAIRSPSRSRTAARSGAARRSAYRINANCGDTTAETTLVDAAWAAWNPASAFTFSRPSTCSTTTLPGANDGNHDIFWSQTSLGAACWPSTSTGTRAARCRLGHRLQRRRLHLGRRQRRHLRHPEHRDARAGTQPQSARPLRLRRQRRRHVRLRRRRRAEAVALGDDTAGVVWIYGARPAMCGSLRGDGGAAWTPPALSTLTSAIVNARDALLQRRRRLERLGAYAASRAGWALTVGDGAKTV